MHSFVRMKTTSCNHFYLQETRVISMYILSYILEWFWLFVSHWSSTELPPNMCWHNTEYLIDTNSILLRNSMFYHPLYQRWEIWCPKLNPIVHHGSSSIQQILNSEWKKTFSNLKYHCPAHLGIFLEIQFQEITTTTQSLPTHEQC